VCVCVCVCVCVFIIYYIYYVSILSEDTCYESAKLDSC
jgi:hypothetical protein